jgi:Ca2+-binding RTX toxin-like protein
VWAGIYTLGAELENAELKGGQGHRLIGNSGANGVVGDSGNDTVFGMDGNDSVLGNDGKDALYGGAGHDTLRGGNLDDQLLGESGNDYLYGDAGNDVITPGTGFDQIWGGSGADRFVFGYVPGQSETDMIHDFQPGVDKLDFSSIDGRAGMAGDQPLAFAFMGQLVGGGQASLNYHFSGGNTVVHVDADGDGNADLAITLIGQTNFLALSDLML